MLFHSVVAASIAAVAFAAPLNEQPHHHHEKRNVVVEYKTVYVDANAKGAQPPAASPVPAAPAAAAPVQQAVVSSQPASSSPAPVAPAAGPALSSPALSSPAPVASKSPDVSSGAGTGGAAGIVYSPYSASGECKSADQVKSDLAKLTGYNIIRIYGVDCNQVANVLAGKQSNQKIFAGIFDVANLDAGISSLASAVKAAPGGWDNVHTVSIGNELVNGGQATPEKIGSLVSSARSQLQSAGYNGPVVSVDTFIAVLNNPALCQHSDYVAINAHAFFDSNCEASNAGKWALSTMQSVASACGGSKKVMITETGWPHQGSANGKAVPSSENQAAAIAAIKGSIGNDAILFTAYDDLWKKDSGATFGAEKYWGFIN